MTANIEHFIDRIIHGDAIEEMSKLPGKSIDMILCDLPYGTTACKWDTVIPFEPLWTQYERIIKDNGAIVLTASQPFTSNLVMSNTKIFRYEWIWEKSMAANFMHLKRQPAKRHENILVFYKKQPVYNPQMREGGPYKDTRGSQKQQNGTYGKISINRNTHNAGVRYPKSVVAFKNSNHGNVHPTQKPVDLFEYLIRTYTNEGEVVLDNCIGSGTTAVAAINTGRRFIGIEKELEYVDIANLRIKEARQSASEEPEQTTIFDFVEGQAK